MKKKKTDNDKSWVKDYTISFFAGLVGALVVVFSLGQERTLNNIKLIIYGVILYFVGILALYLYFRITNSIRNYSK